MTPIGSPAPDLHIAAAGEDQFRIAGGAPEGEVCWQVSGVRQAPFAEHHRPPVEEEKSPSEAGRYLHPLFFGQAESDGIGWTESRKINA